MLVMNSDIPVGQVAGVVESAQWYSTSCLQPGGPEVAQNWSVAKAMDPHTSVIYGTPLLRDPIASIWTYTIQQTKKFFFRKTNICAK